MNYNSVEYISKQLGSSQKLRKRSNDRLSKKFKVPLATIQEARKEYKKQIRKSVSTNYVTVLNPSTKDLLHIDKNTIRINKSGFYIIIGCEHIPGNNKALWDARLKFIAKYKKHITGLIIAGDFMDMYSLSLHSKGKMNPKDVDLSWEYDEANKALDQLDKALNPGTIKVYLMGNHEDRHYRQLKDPDYAKTGSQNDPVFRLDLAKRGYKYLLNWKEATVELGPHLNVFHGEYYNQHTAKKHIDTYRKSCLFFHTHRIQSYIEGQVGGWNGGGGYDKTHEFFNYASKAVKNSWNNGFFNVFLDDQGHYYIQQIMWFKDKFVTGFEIWK